MVVSEKKRTWVCGPVISFQIAYAVLFFHRKKIKRKEVILISSFDGFRHDEVLKKQLEDFRENGYHLNKLGEVWGYFDEIVKEDVFSDSSGFHIGEADIVGKDYDNDVCVVCEVKPDYGIGPIKKAYEQLVRNKRHYEGKFPGVEIRTCMRLDDSFQEIIAQDKSELRKEAVKEFEDEGIYDVISEKKRFYRNPQEQSGIVSVFAESEEEKVVSLCNIVAPVKENVCQSAIERLKNRKRELLGRREYEDFKINTYVKPLGIEMMKVDKVNGPEEDVKYPMIEEVVEKVPYPYRWTRLKDNT
ncbi:MAG: hypothetical protein ACLFQ8_02585 [Candidatus Aenigmatarchaeota archaeon]